MTRWNLVPAEYRAVVKAKLASQLGRPTSLPDDLCNAHASECGTVPPDLSSTIVGPPRTDIEALRHNRHMQANTTLGGRLLALRKRRRGLNQVDVAAEVDITRSHYTKIENDDDKPSRTVLRDLANYFGVTMDYLETGAESVGSQTSDKSINSEDDIAWARLGRELDPAQRNAVFEFIDKFLITPRNVPRRTGRRRSK